MLNHYSPEGKKEVPMLKDRIFGLTIPDDVKAFLDQYPTSIIFKAGTCHKTMQGFGFLQESSSHVRT